MNFTELKEKYLTDMNSVGESDALVNMMQFMQELGNSKQYSVIQQIIDEFCDLEQVDETLILNNKEDTSTFLVNLLVTTFWYGKHLERKKIFQKVHDYFTTVIGYDKKKTDNVLQGLKGNWEPTFGFERELFNIKD